MRHIAATSHLVCTAAATRLLALILSLRSVAQIQTGLITGSTNLCDTSPRQVAATGCRNKSPRVTCENHFRCDRILSLRSVARIQTGLNSCDISQRQNKSKQPCRSVSADEATCHRDVSQRFVASCVSAFMHV